MKKIIASTLLIIMCFTAILGLSGCSDSFEIIFRGKNIVGDVLPIVQDDEVFYPLNDFCDVIDAEYKYSAYEDKITLRNQETEIEIFSEKDIISIDDIRGKLEKRPIMQDGIIFIPLKVVASAFNYNVELKSNKLLITETLNLITKKSDETEIIYYKYDEDGKLLTETSDDYCYTYTYDEKGKLLTVLDQDNEIVESYEYNEKGRVVEQKKDSYIYKFDDRGNTIYREDSDGTILRARYDSNNNILYNELHDTDFNENYSRTCTYDDEGRLLSEKFEGTCSDFITYTYDTHIIIKNCNPGSSSQTTSINDYNGNTLSGSAEDIRSDGNTIEFVEKVNEAIYNESTKQYEFVPSTNKRKLVFNELNLLAEEERESSITSIIYKSLYTYDEFGNLLKKVDKDGNIIESYTYDEFGRLTKYISYDRIIKKYEYNDNGKISYFEDADGNFIRYKYDKNNNLIYKEVKSNGRFQDEYKSRGGVTTYISYRGGTTTCEYMTVKR